MRWLKIPLLLLCGILLFSGSTLAYTLGGEDIGDLDSEVVSANVENSYAAELAWVQSVLGSSYTITEDNKYDTTGLWAEVDGNPDYYALELKGTPNYFYIKLGTGGTDIAYDHWLYHNNEEFNWAVVDSGEWGTTKNIDIFRISHIGEINPVPIPAAVWLLGGGLIGLVGLRRRIKN